MNEGFSRQRHRFYVCMPMEVRFWEGPGNLLPQKGKVRVIETTFTENVSSGGCYFLLSHQPSLGAKLKIVITIPGGLVGVPEGKVCCQGNVIRVDKGLTDGKAGVASTIEMHHCVRIRTGLG